MRGLRLLLLWLLCLAGALASYGLLAWLLWRLFTWLLR